MMKKKIAATVKQVLDDSVGKFMTQCKKCEHYYPKASFCPHCKLEKEAKALRKAH